MIDYTEGVRVNRGTRHVYRTDFSALAANVNNNNDDDNNNDNDNNDDTCDTWTPAPS